MPIGYIHVEWLDAGGLAVLEREDAVPATDIEHAGRVLRAQYLTPGAGGAQPWWRLEHIQNRCWIPVNFDGVVADLEVWLPHLIAQASQTLGSWGSSTLVLAVRSTLLDPVTSLTPPLNHVAQHWAMFGLAYVEGCPFPSASPVSDDAEAVGVVLNWIRGINGQNCETLHEATRGAFDRARARHEAEDARRARIEQLCCQLTAGEQAFSRSVYLSFPNPVVDGDDAFLRAVRDAFVASEHRETLRGRANVSAKALLESCLSPAQLREFVEYGDFHVALPNGRRFRIAARHHGNVLEIVGEKPTVSYCIVTASYVPVHDQMLAQKLMLETAPDVFFKMANRQEIQTERDHDGEFAPILGELRERLHTLLD